MAQSNLTRDEAHARAQLVTDVRYEVDLDLTGTETFGCRAVVRFDATEPGAESWLDFVAPAVHEVQLNGTPLPADAYTGTRVRLPALDRHNEVRVVAEGTYQHTGVGLHRFVDPVDEATYLYTQMETFDAHRVFPCFDQPDVKATFALTVTAPAAWEVVSNGLGRVSDGPGGARQWQFSTTPRLPTYVMSLAAGPFHAVRDRHGDLPLGVFCRRSLAAHLDADEIFEITKQGFDFFQKAFAYPYPFEKYDQLFVPQFNFGAMENVGCVTFSENYVFRSKVTEAERERRAETILHEMAHMWFGDLVTMRWWDDLWLNESFATYMSVLALVEATRFRQAWTTFSSAWKTWAYRQDQLPSTHPIVADLPDVRAADVNLDGITYAKGASVLRQLVAWVGQDEFLTGVAAYFRRHEWGNTTLDDFLASLEGTSGRDLRAWSKEWLETAGVNVLRPELRTTSPAGGEAFDSVQVLQEAPADWPTVRSHRLGIGCYEDQGGRLVRTKRVELDVVGERTEVPELAGLRAPDLLLLNDGDLAYTKIRLDPRSLGTVSRRLAHIDDPLARSLCWSAAWDMLRDAELPARRYLDVVLNNLEGESEISVVDSLLRQAAASVLVFGHPEHRPSSRARLASTARQALERAVPGSDHQLAWARAFAGAARDEADLRELRGLLDGPAAIEGLAVDTDLRWLMVGSLSAAGAPDAEELVAAELRRDATDAGMRHGESARAARPDAGAKAAAWARVADDAELPLATMEAIMRGFQQSDQEDLLRPFVEPYFETVGRMWADRVPDVARAFTQAMYPSAVGGQAVMDRTEAHLRADDLPSPLRRLLMEGCDQVRRVQRTRAADAGPSSA